MRKIQYAVRSLNSSSMIWKCSIAIIQYAYSIISNPTPFTCDDYSVPRHVQPRKGHWEFGSAMSYLCLFEESLWFTYRFRPNIPSYRDSEMFPKHNLVQYYGQNEELIPSNTPSVLEKEFIIRAYVDADCPRMCIRKWAKNIIVTIFTSTWIK